VSKGWPKLAAQVRSFNGREKVPGERKGSWNLFSDGTFSRIVRNQLDYLLHIETGDLTDRARLQQINLGLLAVREIWDLDDQLCELLHEISSFVRHMQSGS
jgi:hypothetical protein